MIRAGMIALAMMANAWAADNWGIYQDADINADGYTDILQYQERVNPETYRVEEAGIYLIDGATQQRELLIPGTDISEIHWMATPDGARLKIRTRQFGVSGIVEWYEQQPDGSWQQVAAPAEAATQELIGCTVTNGVADPACFANPSWTFTYLSEQTAPITIAVWNLTAGYDFSTYLTPIRVQDCSTSLGFDPAIHYRICGTIATVWISPTNADGSRINGSYTIQCRQGEGVCSVRTQKQFFGE